MRSIGHQRHFTCALDSGLSSSCFYQGDRFSAFCHCTVCSWVLVSSLWIPGQGLFSDLSCRISEDVASPAPLSFQDLLSDCLWFAFLQDPCWYLQPVDLMIVIIINLINLKHSVHAGVDNNMECCF